ncbi:MAG: protoporphyrinogen oxidase [Calditrichaceae bacterium]
MLKNETTDTVIVGAGISGLTTARNLVKKGIKVKILEKNSVAGGSIRTEKKDGFLVEYGPNSALETTPLLGELFKDLKIDHQMLYANEKSNNRYIVRGGKLQALPMKPLAFLKSGLFSTRAKLRLFKEPFIAPSPAETRETLAQFVERRLGKEFLDYAIDPFVAGVFAGLPEKLCVQSAFPKLYEVEQKYGSLIKGTIRGARERRKSKETSKQRAKMFSFEDGLQTVIDALVNELGNNLVTESQITGISKMKDGGYEVSYRNREEEFLIRTKSVLLTVPAHVYEKLPFHFEVTPGAFFKTIPYPPVTMVFFGYRKKPENVNLDGFGFLIPKKENKNILGSIWSSTIFPNRAPEGGAAFTTFVGGSRQPENAMLTEDKIAEMVEEDFKSLMGINQKPDVVVIKRWEQAIPQYNLEHIEMIGSVEKFEKKNPGMFISGNFRGGISVADCVKQADAMSLTVSEFINSEVDNINYQNVSKTGTDK